MVIIDVKGCPTEIGITQSIKLFHINEYMKYFVKIVE